MDFSRLFSDRTAQVDFSGIREAARRARQNPGAIDLSIGQPEFAVPMPIKQAAAEAIMADRNGYTQNPGLPELLKDLGEHLKADVGWTAGDAIGTSIETGLMVTSGTSGALLLACLACLSPGDEIIIPDPYFVLYNYLGPMCGGRTVRCDTHPDLRMTAERVEPLITERTKIVLFNSPGNPSGVVAPERDCREMLELCRRKNVLLVCDEIYDELTFSEACTEATADGRERRCPSPARLPGAERDMLLIRGFGKTWGCTGWRLGYAAGPRLLIEQMVKMQQYSFVCAPTPLQWAMRPALRTPMTSQRDAYERRRDLAVRRLSAVTEVRTPGGGFFVYPSVPGRLGESGTAFADRCLAAGVVIIPGRVFSQRDTHVRISLAADDERFARGVEIIARAMGG